MRLQNLLQFTFASLFATCALAQSDDYEQAPIRYSDSKPTDVVSKLQERLNSRQLEFPGTDRETLALLLKELNIPVESQLLVFSKTSVQRVRISPSNPRAMYFNDTC